jgi:hypothetical protein
MSHRSIPGPYRLSGLDDLMREMRYGRWPAPGVSALCSISPDVWPASDESASPDVWPASDESTFRIRCYQWLLLRLLICGWRWLDREEGCARRDQDSLDLMGQAIGDGLLG